MFCCKEGSVAVLGSKEEVGYKHRDRQPRLEQKQGSTAVRDQKKAIGKSRRPSEASGMTGSER